ncbi:MAG: glycosyltransferase family 4 protein [Bacteroidaceae bacterium]|nr:glycosyltransferase family 4 protein [Bacteroidaceae bacterium]
MQKRILYCTPFDLSTGSGIARCSSHIFEYYKKCGADDVYLEILPMDRKFYVGGGNSFFKRVYSGASEYLRIINELKKKIKKKHYDVVHIASSASLSLFKDYLCVRILCKMNIPSIIHFHFGRIPEVIVKNGWEWTILKIVARYATRLIVIDQLSYEALLQQEIYNVEYLPNPLSSVTEKLVCQYSTLSRSENVVLFVGHIVKTKGIYELIEACGEIPNIKLRILGMGCSAIVNELQSFASEYNADDWVEFAGNLSAEDVIKEMCTCAVFALPTYTEGFPNVILESMACGCPIVTTNVGAIPEMLDCKNGDYCGICVAPRDVKGLRNAILRMLADLNYAKSCGISAALRVREMYSMPVVWNRMCEVWNGIK